MTEPLYYITNQYNLREILAGGFIGSRASFDDKYYKDLLEDSPGRIPLFTLPVEPFLFQKVNEHDPETSFAVVLQIDPARLEMDSSVRINEREKDVCIAYAGVIPLKNVSAIHFLSAENLSEFEVRSYSNMPNPRELYRVSPELTQTPGHAPDILQKIKELPELAFPTVGQFSSLDRVSGSISLCICRSEGKEQSKQLLNLLEVGKKTKKTDRIPAWFDLGLERKSKEDIYKLTDIDKLVFASTVTVLHSYNLNSIGQRIKILEEIKQLINAHPAIEEYKGTLDKSFTKIQRLLRLEDDFEPFKLSPGYDTLRGLLLFLMRPHHKELLSWSPSETNASQPVMLTALAYSGIVIGRKGLDTEYRPAKTDLEIAELVVAALNLISKQNDRPVKTDTKTPKTRTTKSQSAITAAGSAVAVPLQLVTASSLDWKTIQEEVLNEKKDDPAFIGSAVWLCRERGWKDCVTAVVNWSVKENFSMKSGQKNELTIRLSGFPEISYELDFEQFKLNLSKLE